MQQTPRDEIKALATAMAAGIVATWTWATASAHVPGYSNLYCRAASADIREKKPRNQKNKNSILTIRSSFFLDHTISRNLALSTDEREPLTMALDLKGHTVPQGLWGPGGDGEALFRGKKGSLQIRLRVKHEWELWQPDADPQCGSFPSPGTARFLGYAEGQAAKAVQALSKRKIGTVLFQNPRMKYPASHFSERHSHLPRSEIWAIIGSPSQPTSRFILFMLQSGATL